MGKRIMAQGGAGAGQHTKMSNQIVIAGTMVARESLPTYGGVGRSRRWSVYPGGAAACWALDNLAPRVAKRLCTGLFVGTSSGWGSRGEADRMNIALPGLALVHQLYIGLRAQGEEAVAQARCCARTDVQNRARGGIKSTQELVRPPTAGERNRRRFGMVLISSRASGSFCGGEFLRVSVPREMLRVLLAATIDVATMVLPFASSEPTTLTFWPANC